MIEEERETSAALGESGQQRDQKRIDDVKASFTACPRCSFFLAGYRLIQQDFEEAVEKSTSGWLDLTWNLAVRNLIQKSFGCELVGDPQVFHGICPACRRAFVYEASQEEGEPDQFSIKINPKN